MLGKMPIGPDAKIDLRGDQDLTSASLPSRSPQGASYFGRITTVCAAIASTLVGGCYYEGGARERFLAARALVVPAQPGDGSVLSTPQVNPFIRGADFETNTPVRDLIDPNRDQKLKKQS